MQLQFQEEWQGLMQTRHAFIILFILCIFSFNSFVKEMQNV